MSKEHRYVGASPEVRKINKQAAVARLTSRLIGNADVSQSDWESVWAAVNNLPESLLGRLLGSQ